MEQEALSITHVRSVGIIASDSDVSLIRDLIDHCWRENRSPLDLFSAIGYEFGINVHATYNTNLSGRLSV